MLAIDDPGRPAACRVNRNGQCASVADLADVSGLAPACRREFHFLRKSQDDRVWKEDFPAIEKLRDCRNVRLDFAALEALEFLFFAPQAGDIGDTHDVCAFEKEDENRGSVALLAANSTNGQCLFSHGSPPTVSLLRAMQSAPVRRQCRVHPERA